MVFSHPTPKIWWLFGQRVPCKSKNLSHLYPVDNCYFSYNFGHHILAEKNSNIFFNGLKVFGHITNLRQIFERFGHQETDKNHHSCFLRKKSLWHFNFLWPWGKWNILMSCLVDQTTQYWYTYSVVLLLDILATRMAKEMRNLSCLSHDTRYGLEYQRVWHYV